MNTLVYQLEVGIYLDPMLKGFMKLKIFTIETI